MKKIILSSVILLSILFLNSCAEKIPAESLKGVENFEVDKYLGKWFEIARTDNSFEKNLNNTTAFYSYREDGQINVKNNGYNYKTENWEVVNGRAKFKGEENVGELKVAFFGPFFGDYNIIMLDDDYKYALVVGSSYDFLWFLSREKEVPEDIKTMYINKAEEVGFDSSEFIWVDHN